MPIVQIISGAQTGAAQGALDAAIHCDVTCGGWIPKGRRCEAGAIPDRYLWLRETLTSGSYEATRTNVRHSDCTLVITLGAPSGSSLQTLVQSNRLKKPWLHLDIDITTRQGAVGQICRWLLWELEMDYDFEAEIPADVILHVSGSPESQAEGIQELVCAIMVDVLRELNPECRRYYPLPRLIR